MKHTQLLAIIRFATNVIVFTLFLANSTLANEALSDVTVQKDIAYLDDDRVDHERHMLDTYTPQGEGPFPVLMWIHGGAWAVGHRSDEEEFAKRFAERGIAVVAIDHRLSKATWINPRFDIGVEHPAHVEDCAAAFAWIHSNCNNYQWDQQRMFVGGFSSGAHLAALLASDERYLKEHGLTLEAIRGALPTGGAYDIEDYYQSQLEGNGKEMADAHVLGVFGRLEGVLTDASPTSHISQSSAPMLVISEQDTFEYTKLFEQAVERAGLTQIRFKHYSNRTHKTIGQLMSSKSNDDTRDLMIAFIRESASN